MKKLVKKGLASFGLELRKVSKREKSSEVSNIPVKVGKFTIIMRSTSLLPEILKAYPNYSRQLGRLVKAVSNKYPKLTVLDVGANFGDSVALIRSVTNVPVICIEGDSPCYALLQQNMKQFDNVQTHKLFFGERTEAIAASFEKEGWNTTIIPGAGDSRAKLELISLDDFAQRLPNAEAVKLVKIDTEGFDCRIIRGASDFIKTVRPVLTFEYNRDNMTRIGESGIETLMMLRDLGYRTIMFYDNAGRLVVSTSMQNHSIVADLHAYANGKDGAIYYYDLCVFHEDDHDLASAFEQAERAHYREKTA